MHLNKITLKNYRNISELEAELDEKNLVIAQNGKGKTNLLEAIYYSIFGSSFRPLENNYKVIKEDKSFAKVVLEWDINTLECVFSFENNRGKRSFKLNNKTARNKELIDRFPVLIFAPHSVNIIADSPAVRRNDLDAFLSVFDNRYFDWISKYRKVIRNRNALLKQISNGQAERRQLEYWTDQLCELGKNIFTVRSEFFEEVQDYIIRAARSIYHDFSDFGSVYKPNQEGEKERYDEILRKKLDDNLEKEIIVGKTLYGVHKDEFTINLNGKSLRYFGSRGQQRIGSFIFKIAQLELIKEKKGKEALVLIDDLFSELDTEHRENLAKILLDFEFQFILTSPEQKEIPVELYERCRLIDLP